MGHLARSGTGAFTLHEDVASRLEEWNNNRAQPEEGLEAYWNQEGVKIRKLMMILSVAERSDLLITPSHWRRAQKMLQMVESSVPSMLRVNTRGSTVDALDWCARFIERKGGLVKHSEVLTYLASKGVRLAEVKIARKHLYEMGKIDFYKGFSKDGEDFVDPWEQDPDLVRRGLYYRWRTGAEPLER